MTANYHTHTPRCKHASGSEEEYIKRAIENGLTLFAFSDHAPFPFKDGYISPSAMDISEIDEYFSTLLTLREKYKGQIEIPIGFEIEYFTDLWKETLELYSRFPIDFLILGEHLVGPRPQASVNSFLPTESISDLKKYVDYCISALNTGKISCICHPDVFNFTGESDIYVKEMSRLINTCIQTDIPLEINLYGMRDGRHYPKDLFWETAGKLGAKAVLGCDCHRLSHVADADEIKRGMLYAEKHGIRLLDRIPLKSPKN